MLTVDMETGEFIDDTRGTGVGGLATDPDDLSAPAAIRRR